MSSNLPEESDVCQSARQTVIRDVVNNQEIPGVFTCQRCGNCCRHAGEVRLLDGEVESMAGLLDIPVHDFTKEYTCLREDRLGLSLRSRADGACIFLETAPHGCRVQAAKPRQCRGFPVRWRYEDVEAICRAYAPAGLPGTATTF